jgi:hypothetical protein
MVNEGLTLVPFTERGQRRAGFARTTEKPLFEIKWLIMAGLVELAPQRIWDDL